MKTPLLIAGLILACSIYAPAQIGNIKGKIKEKTSDSKEATSTETSKKQAKDANGFIINDPEVTALLKGKDVYHSTDLRLFSSILGTSNPFKMAGVGVTKSDETLNLFIVAQKQYGGVYTKDVSLSAHEGNYYEFKSASAPFYAIVQSDQSILIFNSIHAELISKDENAVKSISDEAVLNQKAKEPLAQMKRIRAEENQKNSIAQNEKFYKSGEVKSSKSDSKMEASFLKVLNDANASATIPSNEKAAYSKVMLISNDWSIEKNNLDYPVKMVYAAWAIGSYSADKRCFFQKVYFKKDYIGGGQYGDIKFDEGQSPSVVSCDLLK